MFTTITRRSLKSQIKSLSSVAFNGTFNASASINTRAYSTSESTTTTEEKQFQISPESHNDSTRLWPIFRGLARRSVRYMDFRIGQYLQEVAQIQGKEQVTLTERQKTELANLMLSSLVNKTNQSIFIKWFETMFYGITPAEKREKKASAKSEKAKSIVQDSAGKAANEGSAAEVEDIHSESRSKDFFVVPYLKHVQPDAKTFALICDFHIVQNDYKALYNSLKRLHKLYPEQFSDHNMVSQMIPIVGMDLFHAGISNTVIAKWLVWLFAQFKDISHGHFTPDAESYYSLLGALLPHLESPIALRPVIKAIMDDENLQLTPGLFDYILMALRRPSLEEVQNMLQEEELEQGDNPLAIASFMDLDLIKLLREHNISLSPTRASRIVGVYGKYSTPVASYIAALNVMNVPRDIQQIVEKETGVESSRVVPSPALEEGKQRTATNEVAIDKYFGQFVLNFALTGDEEKVLQLIDYGKKHYSLNDSQVHNILLQTYGAIDLDRAEQYLVENFSEPDAVSSIDDNSPLFRLVDKHAPTKTTLLILRRLFGNTVEKRPRVKAFINARTEDAFQKNQKTVAQSILQDQKMRREKRQAYKRWAQKFPEEAKKQAEEQNAQREQA